MGHRITNTSGIRRFFTLQIDCLLFSIQSCGVQSNSSNHVHSLAMSDSAGLKDFADGRVHHGAVLHKQGELSVYLDGSLIIKQKVGVRNGGIFFKKNWKWKWKLVSVPVLDLDLDFDSVSVSVSVSVLDLVYIIIIIIIIIIIYLFIYLLLFIILLF
jgi:hypothetical protein